MTPSKTDAKRMLDAYLAAKLPGKTNEGARRHAKASLDFANEVTHKRTAVFRQAAMCAEATTAVVNPIAIISGQRDPQGIKDSETNALSLQRARWRVPAEAHA